jgi:hypothetical protein
MEEQMENKIENKPGEPKKETIKEKIMKNKTNSIIIAILLILILAGAGYKYCKKHQMVSQTVKQEALKSKVLDYIKNNLVQAGTDVKIASLEDQGTVYKITLNVGNQTIPAYVSKDGKQFFPEAMDMDAKAEQDSKANQAAQKDIPKSDKPKADLYVMAFCPYGNKAEDTIKSVYQLLKNKVDFNFHYIVSVSGSTVQSLHGPTEVTEDEREACVLSQYGKDKWMNFVAYVNEKCGSDGTCWEAGAKSLNINATSINSCVSSKGVEMMKANEKASKDANASGSPTLIINGVSSNAVYQYGNSEGYKQAICGAFNSAPSECNTALESSSTSSSAPASCGQ